MTPPQVSGTPQNARLSPLIKKEPSSTGKRKLDGAGLTRSGSKRQKATASESTSSTQISRSTLQEPVTSGPSRAYTKHSRFWVFDGNILLQIGIVRFKLHRSRLATQSHWFEKLFAKHVGDTYEGGNDDSVPIDGIEVEMVGGLNLFILDSAGVSVEDFEALLVAMDDGIDFYFAAPSFRTVARILRASTTLCFHKLRKFAKAYVENIFPSDRDKVTETRLEHAAEAVLLGRNWGIPSILKRAFYELARDDGSIGPNEAIVSPVKGGESNKNSSDSSESDESSDDSSDSSESDLSSDGGESAEDVERSDDPEVPIGTQNDVQEGNPMVVDGEGEEEESPQDNTDEYGVESLDPRDLVLLMRGQKHLTASWTSALIMKPIKSCKSKCKRSMSPPGLFQQNTSTGENSILQIYQFDPLCGINRIIDGDWKEWGYCTDCARLRKEDLKQKILGIWDNMGRWFEID